MPRTARQPAFTDIVIDDDELAGYLKTILDNQPTARELTKTKARRAATKKAKTILADRHRDICYKAKADTAWIRVGETALIAPLIVHHEEEERTLTAYAGGKDVVSFDIKPASWQPELTDAPPATEETTMVVDGADAKVRRPRKQVGTNGVDAGSLPTVDEVAFGNAAASLIEDGHTLDEEQRAARERLANYSSLA